MTKYQHLEVKCSVIGCGHVFQDGDKAVMVLWQYEDLMGFALGKGNPQERLEPVCESCAKERGL